MNKHLLFYDGECGFCDRTVAFVMKHDHSKDFYFAPLQGETAKQWVDEKYRNNLETLVLIEDYQSDHPKTHYFGKGAFRTLWLLGGGFKLLGWPYYLPAFLYDWGYRLVARNRKKIIQACSVDTSRDQSRFLP